MINKLKFQKTTVYLFVILLLLGVYPFTSWYQTTGDVILYFKSTTPPGQIFYVFSKFFALYGFFLCWFQIMLGLLPIYKLEHLEFRKKIHPLLGVFTLLTVTLHIVFFATAVSIRNNHFASALFTIRLDDGYYNLMITIGLVAAVLLLLTVISGIARSKNILLSKYLHASAIVFFVLAFIHGFSIGTESRLGAMKYIYISSVVSVCGMMGFKILQRLRKSYS